MFCRLNEQREYRTRTQNLSLKMEAAKLVPSIAFVAMRCGPLAALQDIQVYVLGAGGAGKTSAYGLGGSPLSRQLNILQSDRSIPCDRIGRQLTPLKM
jgi:hypothetical protein